jgi:hypothetical protein
VNGKGPGQLCVLPGSNPYWLILNYLNCDWLQVQGGDSERLGRANYHPFYITTSRTGGFARKLDVEKGGTWIVLQKKLQQLCITVYKNEV